MLKIQTKNTKKLAKKYFMTTCVSECTLEKNHFRTSSSAAYWTSHEISCYIIILSQEAGKHTQFKG